jgi:hypothetical protein
MKDRVIDNRQCIRFVIHRFNEPKKSISVVATLKWINKVNRNWFLIVRKHYYNIPKNMVKIVSLKEPILYCKIFVIMLICISYNYFAKVNYNFNQNKQPHFNVQFTLLSFILYNIILLYDYYFLNSMNINTPYRC